MNKYVFIGVGKITTIIMRSFVISSTTIIKLTGILYISYKYEIRCVIVNGLGGGFNVRMWSRTWACEVSRSFIKNNRYANVLYLREYTIL
jgi:hypothetical protein